MAIVNVTGISGINSITAQSTSLNFYTAAGNTLSIGASVSGNITGNVTGNLTGNVTGNVNSTGVSTFANVQISTASSITVGDTFIRRGAVGLGTTNTTGRNAGVSTAQGTLIFNSDTGSVQVYNGTAWRDVGKEAINATGGYVNEYTDSTTGKIYRAHIFTTSGIFAVPSAPPS